MASINPSLATRNRKTGEVKMGRGAARHCSAACGQHPRRLSSPPADLDLDTPPQPVAALVQALEALRSEVAGTDGGVAALAVVLEAAVSAVLSRALAGSTVQARLACEPSAVPAGAAAALCSFGERADAALAALAGEALGEAALQAIARFAVRSTLPLFAGEASLALFPCWLERAAWQRCPSLAAASFAGEGTGLGEWMSAGTGKGAQRSRAATAAACRTCHRLAPGARGGAGRAGGCARRAGEGAAGGA